MAKTIVLLRHGHYEEGSSELSARGVFQIESVASKLIEEGLVGRICYSPIDRAVQSAQILRKAFDSTFPDDKRVGFEQQPWLRVNHGYNYEVAEFSDQDQVVILVTHEPNIQNISWIFGQSVRPGHAQASVHVRESWAAFAKLPEPKIIKPEEYKAPPPSPPPPPPVLKARSSEKPVKAPRSKGPITFDDSDDFIPF